ncbi:MAG: insulinase family protein [Planctomycetes bacterium]|nr:insulinase family protein [Planctomycetota bacterium]
MILPKVHEVRLDNGFRALLVERHNLPVVASLLVYEVGARDERTGETGLSHFLEHMMFKGTERFGKGMIDLLTAKLGGSNNAFTDNDVTAYHFSLAADRWDTALEIEANRMRGCLLDEKEFAAEKSVVLEELAMGEDDPARMLYQTAESLVFQVHPYHHPVIGWKEDLQRLDVAGMRAYYERHYGPNRAFLVAIGDFDLKTTEARVRELFAGIPPLAQPRAAALQEPQQKGERRAVVRFPGNIPRLALAARSVRVGEADDFPLDLLAFLLGHGKTARLYQRLVLKEQIATDVVVANESRLDPGVFWILAELHEDAQPAEAERMVRAEIERIALDGVSAADLRRVRTQIRAGFLFEGETVLDLAVKLGRYEASAREGYRLLDRVLPAYDAVRPAQVRAVAERYLAPDSLTAVWSVPESFSLAQGTRRSKAARARR